MFALGWFLILLGLLILVSVANNSWVAIWQKWTKGEPTGTSMGGAGSGGFNPTIPNIPLNPPNTVQPGQTNPNQATG